MRLRSFLLITTSLACAGFASADTITATITPTRDLYDVVFAFAYDSSSLFGTGSLSFNYFQVTSGSKSLTAGLSKTISEDYTNYYSLPIVATTLFAKYDDASGSGATVGYDMAAGDALISASSPWPFHSTSPYGEVSETTFVNALATNNADQFDIVFRRLVKEGNAAAFGEDVRLVNFSGATNGGTVTNVQAVPEPTTLVALAGGLVAWRRKRRV